MKIGILLLTIMLVFFEVAAANSRQLGLLDVELENCSAIKDDKERLECYDNLAPKKNEQTKQESKSYDNWTVTFEKSKIDDSKNVIIFTSSIDDIANKYGKSTKPILVLRCQENENNMYVLWEIFLGTESIPVVERIDKKKAQTSHWGISTDHTASFKRSPIGFIKSLSGAERLLLQLTPYGDNPKTAEFNITGIETIIEPLKNACKWK